jgi:hypothetical protein
MWRGCAQIIDLIRHLTGAGEASAASLIARGRLLSLRAVPGLPGLEPGLMCSASGRTDAHRRAKPATAARRC